MEVEITGDGTVAFYLREGRHRLDVVGTLGGSTSIALKAGGSPDGTGHVAVKDRDGTAIAFATSMPEPPIIEGSGYFSLVTTSYSGSSGVAAHLRKAEASAL